MTGSFHQSLAPEINISKRGSEFFHRPRILLVFLFLLFSTLIHSQTTDPNVGATLSVSVGTTSSFDALATPSPSSTPTSSTPITIPQPFDTADLADTGSNFTSSSCPSFMRSFLANQAFQNCVPFSLLLYTSSAFFSLTRSVSIACAMLIQGSFAVTQVLDQSCSASPSTCGNLMNGIASELVQDSNCGLDIKAQNPI